MKRKDVFALTATLVSIVMVLALLGACAVNPQKEPAPAPALAMTTPESVGLSSERLARIDALIQADIDAGNYPGAVLLIARKGKTAYFKSFGKRDEEKDLPMEKDAIFRIHSVTKPITGIAIAQLMEQGKLMLNDPVYKYLPAFRDVEVAELVVNDEGKEEVVLRPPKTPITILDLLRHTSGISYWFMAPKNVRAAYHKAGMRQLSGMTNLEMCDKIASLPLICDPGTEYNYSRSFDVLGGVIEVIAGQPLEAYIREKVCMPLGMKDSGYIVPEKDADRLVAMSTRSPFYTNPVDKDKVSIGGGGMMVGTAMDLARFGQMLLNGGEIDGLRFLSPTTVALATADHLGELGHRTDQAYQPGAGHGQGFGFYVRTSLGGAYTPGHVGEYFKQGIGGVLLWVDPEAELVAAFMVTKVSQRETVRYLMKDMIYQAIVE